MQTDAYRLWSTRIVTFAVSALAAASVGYWGVRGWGPPVTAAPPATALMAAQPGGPQAVARALGGGRTAKPAAAGTPAAISRYALLGIVASRGGGAALISVDGQEARPVRVGNPIEGGLVLQSVSPRRAVLASSLDAPAAITLDLPLPVD
ncbi:MAG: type II secretion system protein N [Polaromonas sp.]